MRKIILDLAISLDGYIEGPNQEIDWCIMDDEMNFDGFLSTIDTIFYGRVSYDRWGNFQPPANAPEAETTLWQSVHKKEKYVFSSEPRLDPNATFISSDFSERITEIKSRPGKDIWLYGGARLIESFIKSGFVDTYRISIHPLALGSGTPLFSNLKERLSLKLTGCNVFRSGVVQMIYEPEKKQ